MQLTADLIFGFSGSLLQSRYDEPKPTPEFHKEVWEYCCKPDRRVGIAAPRSHAKSTAVTHAYVLASALFRASSFIIIVSDTEPQAIQFLNDIKMELRENEDLIELFKVRSKFSKETERELICEIGEDRHKFRILARGASGGSGSVRGFKWRHKRPDLIVCDDIEDDEAVLNEERRAKFREWFFEALIPTLSDSGKIRVVGTILHFDSLLERIMPPTEGPGLKYTRTEGLKQWSDNPDAIWTSVKYRAHTDFDDFSEILWPEKFSEKRLKTERQSYVDQGNPEGYAQEYLNYPHAEESAFFRKQDFLPMEDADYDKHEKRLLRYYAAGDLAISQKDKRSFTAIVVGGMDDTGHLHIVDVIRERMEADGIINALLDIQIRYRPDLFVLEKGQISLSIGPYLKDEEFKRGVFLNKVEKSPINDKKSRARPIQGRMRQGGVKFNTRAEWWPSYFQEMLRFDKGEYDDQVDATAWIGQVLNELVTAPTEKEREQFEYEDELNESMQYDSMSFGRSRITGY